MTGRRASLIWLVLLGAAIGLFAGLWLLPVVHRLTAQAEAIDRLEQEGERLAAQVESLTQELSRRLAGSAPAPTRAGDEVEAARAEARAEAARRLEDVRRLTGLQQNLEEANTALADARGRIADLEAAVAHAAEENKLLRESEADLKEQLARSSRVVEAMRAELKGNTDRLVKLEARNRSLIDQNEEFQQTRRRIDRLTQELEGLYKRREDLLSEILRRSRDVSDEYRNLALQLSSFDRGGAESTLDLSRIQNALSLADEDLRQLRSLDARAARIQSELAK
jgi:chromosome segregation ATPase